ncbi:protein N-lysine methyltransferase METTL21D-like [Dermatophagoides pteronyssinus]|uniref:protein N-lysine methyltransferase METTL21D-like n=1 Tax=Dermatophagoides pteronyssinus TaxID=6956 RepID=UPI003F67DE60
MFDNNYFSRQVYFDHPELAVNYDITESDDENPSVTIIQKYDSDESGVVWDAAILLAKYLEYDCHCHGQSMVNLNVIELGSGTGFVGIWCAAMGASVMLTDLQAGIPLIKLNMVGNSSLFKDEENVLVKSFDWFDRSEFQWEFLRWKTLDEIDYILISDCLYYEQGMIALVQFIKWTFETLISRQSHTRLRILISYEDRHEKMQICNDFFQKLNQFKHLKCETITNEQLHPDYRSNDLHLLRITYATEC